MTTLVNQSARLSYYMLLFLSLPIIVNIDFILSIWLKIVPDRTTTFVILTIIFTLIESLSNPLITAQLATGKVRNYQLLVGGINLLNLPVSYVFLKLGTFPEIVLLVAIALSIVCLIARLVMLKQTINFNIKSFTKAVILNCSIVTTLSLVVPIILSHYCEPNWWSFFLSVFICISSTAIIVLFVGCSKEERTMILSKISPSIKNG